MPLLVTLPASRVRVRQARKATLRFFVSGPANVTLRLVRRDRTVKTIRRSYKGAGRRQVSLGRLKRGRYRVVLVGVRDTFTSADRSILVVR